MSDAVSFDVVIPSGSRESALVASVRSALVSPLVSRVVVVVTNTQVRHLAMALAFEDSRVRVLGAEDSRGASCNAGLNLCSADWVAFLDEGDRFAPNYFENLAKMINDDFRLGVVFTRLLDAGAGNADIHPLRFRFAGGSRVVDLVDEPGFIPSSAFGAVFHRETLSRSNVAFREDLIWSVETDFVVRFLMDSVGLVGICAEADYLFSAGSAVAVVDVWGDPHTYSRPFELAFLPWASAAQRRFGALPEWLQNLLLFELCAYLEADGSPGHVVHGLPLGMREWCAGLVLATLGYLDADVIERFSLVPVSADRRAVLLSACRQRGAGVVGARVFEGARGVRPGLLEFSYFWAGQSLPVEEVWLGDRLVAGVEGTWVSQRLFGIEFVRERILRFHGFGDVRFVIDGRECEVVAAVDSVEEPVEVSVGRRFVQGELLAQDAGAVEPAVSGDAAVGRRFAAGSEPVAEPVLEQVEVPVVKPVRRSTPLTLEERFRQYEGVPRVVLEAVEPVEDEVVPESLGQKVLRLLGLGRK